MTIVFGAGNAFGVDAALRNFATKGGTKVENSSHQTLETIDERLSSQASSILQERIQFVAAEKPQELVANELKAKYVVVSGTSNSTSRPSTSSSIPSVGSMSQRRESGGAEGVFSRNGCSTPTEARSFVPSGDQTPSTSSDPLFSYNVKQRPSFLPTTSDSSSKEHHVISPVILSPTRVPDGIPEPQFEISSTSHLAADWSVFKPHHPLGLGLHNVGNTCFLNSVLQVLTHTPPLTSFLVREHRAESCSVVKMGHCTMCELRDHIVFVFNSRRSQFPEPVVPNRILHRMRLIMKTYQRGRQEDAHEFLRYLIDSMQTACLTPHKGQKLDMFTKGTTIINKIFGGYHRNEITCLSCNTKSTTYDPFMDISLEIKGQGGIEEALKHFTKAEILSSENAYKCLKCRKPVGAKKMYTIHRPPAVLTIHLKRFDHLGKLGHNVKFTEKLNLRQYMSEKDGPQVMYKLYGVVVHQGNTTHSGHYYAFVRNTMDTFHLMDDSRVSAVSAKNVLNQPGYLLFYARQSTQTAAVKPQTRPAQGPSLVPPQVKRDLPQNIPQTEPHRVEAVRPLQTNARDPVKFTFKLANGERSSKPDQPLLKKRKEEKKPNGLVKLVPYDVDEEEEESPKSSKNSSPAPKRKSPPHERKVEAPESQKSKLVKRSYSEERNSPKNKSPESKGGSEERTGTKRKWSPEEHPPDPVVNKAPVFNIFEHLTNPHKMQRWSPVPEKREEKEKSREIEDAESPRKKKKKKHRHHKREEEVEERSRSSSSRSSSESNDERRWKERTESIPQENIRIKLNLKDSTVEQLTPLWSEGGKKRNNEDGEGSETEKTKKRKKKKHKKKKKHDNYEHHRSHDKERGSRSPRHKRFQCF